ncbi:MAG: DNA translocase FtsK 4TM domain-containing protein [Gammaproteobacteria bacterium]|nr:DNA translocase FtsK 4TM domain-containing protein [Gammaproteobacteria bacterium]
MSQATRKNPRSTLLIGHTGRVLREIGALACGALALYLFWSLLTFDAADSAWSHSGVRAGVANQGGVVGAWLADIFFYLFGYLAYLFPVLIAYAGWWIFREYTTDQHQFGLRVGGFMLALSSGAALAAMHFADPTTLLPQGMGGILGEGIATGLVRAFSFLGATLFLLAAFLIGVTLLTRLSWFWVMDNLGRACVEWGMRAVRSFGFYDYVLGRRLRLEREVAAKAEKQKAARRAPPRIEPVIKPVETGVRVEKERQVSLFEQPAEGALPPLSLLDAAEPQQYVMTEAALEAISRQVEMKLADFGVEAQVVAVHPGPVITRFELQPAAGVKVSQISSLSKDLARSLSVMSVRVVDVIPGKSVIGLEIPNEQRSIVRLSETLQSKEYEKADSPIALGLGKDISGHPVVVDLAKMPHLLVAGTTGSGKSVALNAMLLSILFNATARDVRLIMIDPKMLELSVYEGIPHLLTPVVTDVREAANALRWCVAEMDRRYKLMAALGVRNIAGLNRKIKDAEQAKQPLTDPLQPAQEGITPPLLQTLPLIVVIIDELADMMMVVGKKVEGLITRLAQKARASGIHMILATQRPSVDVITGIIKANIPVRIAFQVSSRVDSRTILDQMGAEQLLGHGDMLYLAPGGGTPLRVHGAFVADQEVHQVVAHLKRSGVPSYLDEVLRDTGEEQNNVNGDASFADGESDPLYDQAVSIVLETRRASVSGIQRRLKVGYNRAARMIEEMERAGVVGPLQSNGMREVLTPPPPGR